jgi:hypothetical protein
MGLARDAFRRRFERSDCGGRSATAIKCAVTVDFRQMKLKDPAVGQAGPLGPTFSPFKNTATLLFLGDENGRTKPWFNVSRSAPKASR